VGRERPPEDPASAGAGPPAGGGARLVLAGAGHAHLHSLRRSAELVRRGHRVTLVAPDSFWYSGLATGVLGGLYPPSLDQVDAGALAVGGGGEFIRDQVVGIDPAARTLWLAAGPPLVYDVLSLNLGSLVPLSDLPGAGQNGYAVKPIRRLWELRQELESRFSASERSVRVLVAGGGASGCEVAANIEGLARARGGKVEIELVTAGQRILERFPASAARKAAASLERRRVRIVTGVRVSEVAEGWAAAEDGRRFPFDLLVHCQGLVSSPLLGSSGLPTARDGSLIVDERLRSVADPRIHGAGDCIAIHGNPLPRIGVHAVRQGPILFRNLLAALEGQAARPYRPRRRHLLILNLGDGTGLATWGPFSWHGRLAFRLKDRIDRRFLDFSRRPSGVKGRSPAPAATAPGP
jgi:NADH dehydrogenase FAD-containing subunit